MGAIQNTRLDSAFNEQEWLPCVKIIISSISIVFPTDTFSQTTVLTGPKVSAVRRNCTVMCRPSVAECRWLTTAMSAVVINPGSQLRHRNHCVHCGLTSMQKQLRWFMIKSYGCLSASDTVGLLQCKVAEEDNVLSSWHRITAQSFKSFHLTRCSAPTELKS